ncbi:restriction endonuclease subunit S [Saccharicrinis aurantiacus]|uniref:restriction endonuclease subunit S n=1 Tax=Saccharicrinis aurantiacus TaxID=1849719 RepID=UPI002490BFE9|nr:restriction endonuclease subunit S [Saccharicrinis aurantiacus]
MQLLEHFKELTIHPKNTKELKGLILQLAIQGKLTQKWREQNSNVEPASVLLEKIKEEKAQLIKDKKIKKEKALPEITEDETPFELPDSWCWSKMQNICFIITDGAHHTPKYIDSGVPFLSVKNLSKGGIDFSNTKFISEVTHKELIKRCNPEFEDILLTKIGTTGIAKVIDVKHDFSIFVSVALLKIVKSYLYPYFIEHCINSPFIKKQSSDGTEGVGNKNLVLRKIKSFLLPIPPLEEQKAIVSKVNQLFKEVEALEKQTQARVQLKEDFVTSALRQLTEATGAQNQNGTSQQWDFLKPHFKTFFTSKAAVKKLRETILQLAVQGKLTTHWRTQNTEIEPASLLLEKIKAEKAQLIKDKKIKKEKPLPEITAEEMPYELPDGWVWCRLTELVDVGTGSTPAKSNLTYYEGGNIPWYTSSATNDEYAKVQDVMITQKALDETNCKIFPTGSLIIAMYGQGKTRGQISELITAGATNQAIAAMVFFESSKNTKQYLKYYFQKFYHEIRLLAEGGAQPNLNVGKVKATLIPLPSTIEMNAIVAKTNSLMALCDQLEQEIAQNTQQVEDLMQSCLREVFEPII